MRRGRRRERGEGEVHIRMYTCRRKGYSPLWVKREAVYLGRRRAKSAGRGRGGGGRHLPWEPKDDIRF